MSGQLVLQKDVLWAGLIRKVTVCFLLANTSLRLCPHVQNLAHFLLRYPSTTLSSRLMSGYKIAQLGFQTFTLPFGLDVLQARLAGVSVDRSCWRGRCGQSSAVGPPSGRCSAPRAPLFPGQLGWKPLCWRQAMHVHAPWSSSVWLVCQRLPLFCC